MAQRKRKSRKPGSGNPFAGRDAEIAELKSIIAAEREQRDKQLQQVNLIEIRKEQELSQLRSELEAARKQYSAYERGEVERNNTAHKDKQMLHREITFLRETIFRLAGSGFQLETVSRVVD
jgi:hypothetical protein